MLEGIAIGGGVGLAAVVTLSVFYFILHRNSQAQTERAWSRGDELAKRLDTALEDITEHEKAAAILHTNISELKRELGAKDGSISELTARIEAVEKARANLAAILKRDPRLVTAALSAAFDELREEVSRAQAAAAARDSGRQGAGPVHEAAQGGAAG